ncbi:MAG: poly-gamma-glutamate system protein [Phycisphaerae bacterium]|nr:poly-gamma-glutamate system protein [Phycisphaerae bacterium]
MKTIYWRPHRVSRTVLILICGFSLVGLAAVEVFKTREQDPWHAEKLAAARQARDAMEIIKTERLNRGIEIDPETDPVESGMIGTLMTVVTSDPGSLPAKQTTANPNWAAVLVHMLKRAGVKPGDRVAVGLSGSFPCLNICTFAAVQALQLEPIIIASAAASQWGANDPNFLWLDMEKVLQDDRVFPFRSVAASVGGIEDRGLGMSNEGRDLLIASIQKHKLTLIKAKTFAESLQQRMSIYKEKAAGKPIKAYINVGGGTVSVGTRVGKKMFKPGLTLRPPPGAAMVDSVMTRFALEDVPVIHLVQIEELATRYGLPVTPAQMPTVGEGRTFYKESYNRGLAGIVLMLVCASLYGFVRTGWGFSLLQGRSRSSHDAPPEPMV